MESGGRRLGRSSCVHVLAAAFALLPAASCKQKTPPATTSSPVAAKAPAAPVPGLGDVTVEDVTPDNARIAGVAIDTKAITDLVKTRLGTQGLFAPASDGGADSVRARVRLELSTEDVVAGAKAAARAAVRLRIDTRPSEMAEPHWNEDVQAGSEYIYKPASKPDKGELFQRLVARTVSDLLDGYLGRQRLWRDDGTRARTLLTADAGDMRLEAIRAIADRHLTGAGPDLLKLLDDADEAVRDAALGALVELRERRAVGVLANQKSMRDAREMRKILDAISVLGGDEAAEYLGFVADGHDDPEIRKMAADARQRLLRRHDQAGSDPSSKEPKRP